MSIGIWQVILILVIVLILFGAGKLPKVMGDVAKGVKSFKAGLRDDEEAPPPTVTPPQAPLTAQRPGAPEAETKPDATVQR